MLRIATRPLLALALAFSWLVAAVPARAAVTVTFWSHEFGNDFPHAFISLYGTLDATGAPVDANFGFTAKTISPAILFGPVPGRIDIAKPGYVRGSDAQFSLVVSDAQYAELLALVEAWSERAGNSRYDMNDRNCVTFVKEAARIVGLTGLEQPKLMKKPRSFLKAIAAENAGRITPVEMHGKAYLATLAPLTPVAAAPVLTGALPAPTAPTSPPTPLATVSRPAPAR